MNEVQKAIETIVEALKSPEGYVEVVEAMETQALHEVENIQRTCDDAIDNIMDRLIEMEERRKEEYMERREKGV